MNSKIIFFGLLFYLHYQVDKCNTEVITYISTERPAVYWYDTKTFKNFTLLSKRLTRRDPRHYVEMCVHTLVTVNNNLKVDFYFHQFLTNRYQRSFVEMHFTFCDMVRSDIFFGQAMRTALGGRDCPFPPGLYDMKNMSIPYVPTGFPFTKGRIYCNTSLTEGGSSKLVAWGSIDMEITYFNAEHPVLEWYDRRYFKNATVLSRRVSRQDPRHYFELYIHSLFTINNDLSLDFFFYQFLTNRYQPSFVEMHFKFCDMMNADPFFGRTIRNAAGGHLCPFPAGVYDFKNMTIGYVPKGFPFTKGRIYCNVSLSVGGVTKVLGKSYIDMEIKVFRIGKN